MPSDIDFDNSALGSSIEASEITWPLAKASAATTTDVLQFSVTGDAANRFVVNADGKLEWGSGSAATDTTLERSSTSTLNVNGKVKLNGASGIVGADFFGTYANTGPYLDVSGTSITATNRTTTTYVPLTVKGMASQSGDLQQWQDSAGTVLTKVESSGAFSVEFSSTRRVRLVADASFAYIQSDRELKFTGVGSGTRRIGISTSNDEILFGSAGDTNLYRSAADTLKTDDAFVVGATAQSQYFASVSNAGPYIQMTGSSVFLFNRTTTTNVALAVKGMAAQTGDLQQWQDSSGTVLAKVTSAGNILAPDGSATVPSIGWVSDADGTGTGFYRPAANKVEITCNSTRVQQWSNLDTTILDAIDIVLGTTTGTKIGTATTQKIGLWGATPAVQPTAVADASGGATVDAEARTAINNLLARLRTIGALAT